MRIFTLAFLGKVAAVIFIAFCTALGFGPDVWVAAVLGTEIPLWVWVARAALVLWSLLLTWAIFLRPAISGAKVVLPYQYRPEDADIVPIRTLIPLPDAARIAYEKLRGRTLNSQKPPAKFADMKDRETAHPISWFGIALLGEAAIPLFGRHPPSTVLEIVPENLVKASGHLADDANSISQYGMTVPEYEHLFIKKSDFRKRLKEIESWHLPST